MKSLVLALLLVIYASSPFASSCMAQNYGLLSKGLDGASQRVGRDYQSLARLEERADDRTTKAGRAAVRGPRYTHVNANESTATTLAPKAMVAVPQAVNAGWAGCPCGADCKCATDAICEAGDCKKNYVMLATAKWCRYCPAMKLVAEQLRKEGYIVHVVEYDANKDKLTALGVRTLPTTLVFADGKVDKFFGGVTAISQIRDGLKTRAEQDKPPEPKQPAYNFKQ
jgi:thiol-disulfide isomerase/thioredoxin